MGRPSTSSADIEVRLARCDDIDANEADTDADDGDGDREGGGEGRCGADGAAEGNGGAAEGNGTADGENVDDANGADDTAVFTADEADAMQGRRRVHR